VAGDLKIPLERTDSKAMKPWPACCVAACILLTLSAPGPSPRADEMYRWLDSAGRLHFGSSPPPDARKVELVTAPAASVNVVPSQEEVQPPASSTESASPPTAAKDRVKGRSREEWYREAMFHEEMVRTAELNYESFEARVTEPIDRWEESTLDNLRAQRGEAEDRRDAFVKRALDQGVPRAWLGLPPTRAESRDRRNALRARNAYDEAQTQLDEKYALARAQRDVSTAESEVSRNCTKVGMVDSSGRVRRMFPFGVEDCRAAQSELHEALEALRELEDLYRKR